MGDLKALEEEIYRFEIEAEQDFSETKGQTIKQKVELFNQKLGEIQENKDNKAKIAYLKGKNMGILPEYSKQAEEMLSKALRLDPNNINHWNSLGKELWKKKDYEGAQKFYENGMQTCGTNKVSLRQVSIVLRCIPTNKQQNVQKSVEIAKQALNLDIMDGESWYILGNAYLSNFFTNMKKLDELDNAVKAYKKAEQLLSYKNPDLYYNRAQIYNYLEDYNDAIEQYQISHDLDRTLQADQLVISIQKKFSLIYQLIQDQGKINAKRLQNMVNAIPCIMKNVSKSLEQHQLVTLSSLKEGGNKGLILTAKITHVISQVTDVPATFVYVDIKSNFGAVSIYNASSQIYEQCKENTDICIVDPMVKTISIERIEGSHTYKEEYKCIQVFDINKFFCDQQKISECFSPNVLQNETFQN